MRKEFNAIICRNLVKVRMSLKYSQNTIANALHIKQPSYARMESGRTRISADQLGVLANFYNVPVHIFFADTYCLAQLPRQPSVLFSIKGHNPL